jgi:hypothetical protein
MFLVSAEECKKIHPPGVLSEATFKITRSHFSEPCAGLRLWLGDAAAFENRQPGNCC